MTIHHYVLGQAGSGKSTFIEQTFPSEHYIHFNTGNILRGMFDCMKQVQDQKNVWNFANPIVYGIYKNCSLISSKYGFPLVTDGFPRNRYQMKVAHRWLNDAHPNQPMVIFHMLYISEQDQISRLAQRNGVAVADLSDYEVERVKQSRSDFDGVVDEIEHLIDSGLTQYRIKLNWYKQEGGGFVLDREY